MKTQDSKIVKARRQIYEQIVKLSKKENSVYECTVLIKLAYQIMGDKNVQIMQ